VILEKSNDATRAQAVGNLQNETLTRPPAALSRGEGVGGAEFFTNIKDHAGYNESGKKSEK
jgi:hypothetical protein